MPAQTAAFHEHMQTLWHVGLPSDSTELGALTGGSDAMTPSLAHIKLLRKSCSPYVMHTIAPHICDHNANL